MSKTHKNTKAELEKKVYRINKHKKIDVLQLE